MSRFQGHLLQKSSLSLLLQPKIGRYRFLPVEPYNFVGTLHLDSSSLWSTTRRQRASKSRPLLPSKLNSSTLPRTAFSTTLASRSQTSLSLPRRLIRNQRSQSCRSTQRKVQEVHLCHPLQLLPSAPFEIRTAIQSCTRRLMGGRDRRMMLRTGWEVVEQRLTKVCLATLDSSGSVLRRRRGRHR